MPLNANYTVQRHNLDFHVGWARSFSCNVNLIRKVQFVNALSIVEILFQGKIKPLTSRLRGEFLDNTDPSSWGVLKYQKDIVGLIFLNGNIEGYGRVRNKIFHAGPKTMISN